MRQPLQTELRHLLPVWLFCVLLPLPAIIFSRSDDGIPWRFSLFSVGCASFVAYVFKRYTRLPVSQQTWGKQMAIVGLALLAAVIVFSTLCLAMNGPRDLIVVFKAIYVSILALCIVPYLALVTRKLFTTVALSIFLVFCLKLLGCVVVVLVYGWDASEHDYTTTPWTHPNLLVWLFWSFTALLSSWFCVLSVKKSKQLHQAPATPSASISDGMIQNGSAKKATDPVK
jgi:hypothetical protein